MPDCRISFIIPCCNESGNIHKISAQIRSVFSDEEIQLIFIDDGSQDSTLEEITALSKEDTSVHYVSFSRNFGKEAAMLAGLEKADGKYTVLIDADLQQDPSVVKQMVSILDDNDDIDCVCAVPSRRKESLLMSFLKSSFYRIISHISDIDLKENASDFRCFRNNVRTALLSAEAHSRFTKGLFAWAGFRTEYIEYEVRERESGTSKWPLIKLLKYALSGITSFSSFFLILPLYLGIFTIVLTFLLMLLKLPSFSLKAALLLFMAGLFLICLGIIGAYMNNIAKETRKRPLYIVKENSDEAY